MAGRETEMLALEARVRAFFRSQKEGGHPVDATVQQLCSYLHDAELPFDPRFLSSILNKLVREGPLEILVDSTGDVWFLAL